MKPFFIRNFVNPIIWKYVKKSSRFEIFDSINCKQWRSLKKNQDEQAKKLYELVRYAHKNVPYYKKIIQENNIHYSRKTIFDDIKKFPILTKQDMKNNFEDLKSQDITTFSKNTSGGSTGQPVVFLQDNNYYDWNAAGKVFYYSWAGRNEGEFMIKLWGSERDIIEGTQGLDGFLIKHMMNIQLLNSFKMSEKNMRDYVKIINTKKPKIMESYVQSIYELAIFIEKKNLSIYSPKGIIVSAGILYPHMREKIETVFGTKVFNRYGTREVGDIACSCEFSDELHINMFHSYVEVLDSNLTRLDDGNLGHIHITNLNNKVMPLIRYDIGDMGEISKNYTCKCGRGLIKLKEVKGREMNMFKSKSGDLIPGEFFIHFVGVVHNKGNIEKFQIIQERIDLIKIKYILKDSKGFEENKYNVEKDIKKVMGEDCNIIWDLVKEIPPSKSGKYLYTIREVN